ncbi:hypothetical protein NA56DRAFT_711575 [Hyaloscypha hepaticicola]|jgi:hypothetical protein|uniref:Uncharacterized protein n=1 Tax=Hyaloscypha hepaticicola TaxID=2082293 RepID=A0A2J6PIT2_9HELO|nr:hypothetical protein NA56DRAFT_711575 [Hyaloscypha hepaticicola]
MSGDMLEWHFLPLPLPLPLSALALDIIADDGFSILGNLHEDKARTRFQAPHTRETELTRQAAAGAAYVVMYSCFAATCSASPQMRARQSSLNFFITPSPAAAALERVKSFSSVRSDIAIEERSLDNLIAVCRGSIGLVTDELRLERFPRG